MKQRFMRLAVLGLSVTTIGGMSVTAFAAEPTGEEAQSITIEAPAENVETPEVTLTTVEGDEVTTAETPVDGEAVTTPEETADVTAPIAEVPDEEPADGEISVDGEGEENIDENMGEDATGSGEENAGAEDGTGSDTGSGEENNGSEDGTEDGTGSGSGDENTGEGDGSGEDGSGEDGSGEDGGDVVETGTASVEVSGLEFDGSSDVVMTVKYVGTKTPVNVDFYSNIIQINGHPFSVYTVEETSDGAVIRLSKDELASSWYGMEYGKTYSFTLEDYAMDVQFEDGSWESVPVNGTFTLTYLVGGNTGDGGDEGDGGNTGENPDGGNTGENPDGGDNTGDGSEDGGDNTGDGSEDGGDSTGDGGNAGEDGDNTVDGSEDDGGNTGDGSNNGGNTGNTGNDANGGTGNGGNGNNNSNANGNNQQTVVRSTNSAPQTGDMTAVMPYVGGMLSSMVIAIGAFLKKFRK